jgi:hypothetical protein
MSCCPSAATLLRHQNLAKLLFPEMAAVAALQKCTEDMLAERGLLLTSEVIALHLIFEQWLTPVLE